tara:strand:+ start:559 stop:3381 length:2823 start_codon:yes stop_codon:yes gene_type:complete
MSQLFVDTIRNRDGNGAPVFDKGIVISGIITASGSLAGDSVSIGVTEVVSSSFELKNITGIDSTTTATIESAIANAPNDFTSLNVSGISTFGDDIDLNADIDIFGHTAANTVAAAGILTALLLSTGAEGSAIRISSSTISGSSTITIDPAGIGTNTGTVVIQGDLQVDGDTTTVNSTNLTVDDKNIILASGSLTDASSDGGGITLESGEGNKTINWVNSTDSWTFSENIDLAASKTFKIEGTDVLSSTAVGSAVTNSSLQNVGTLAGVQVSGAATFSSNISASGDLDIDGQTDLDHVAISGVSTFSNAIDANGDLDVDGTTDLDVLNVAETATFSSDVITGTGATVGFGSTAFFRDNARAAFGDGGDLEVYHDGDSYIKNTNSVSNLFINSALGLQLRVNSSEAALAATANGSTELYYDGSKKFETISAGATVTGTTFSTRLDVSTSSTFGGDIDANGDLDVDGHTNLDNVSIAGVATVGLTTVLETGILTHDLNVSGVSTFNGDIRLTEQDGSGIYFGAGLDFAIAHDGSNSYLFERGGTGNVYLAGSNEVIIADASGSGPNPSDYVTETKARFVTNGPVRLYYDNVEKFATAGSGATVYGTFTADTLSVSGISTFTGDIDVDGHTNLDNVNVSGAITATTFTGNLDGTVNTAAQANITSLGTLTGLTVSGNITAQADLDVDGHTNLDNVSVAGVTTITGDLIANEDIDLAGDIDVDGHTNLDNVNIAGVTTFASNIDADGNLDVDGTTDLDVLNVAETATFSANIDANKSVDVAGNLNALTFRAGLSTFTGFVYNELDTSTNLRNSGDFNAITGVAFTAGSTDTLYWDFATAPSVIGGEASNGITNIELASLPTNREYMVRATLITFTDASNDWDTGNVVLKVNGQTPTNYLWRNGAQPVGTTTGAANQFDIVEFKIVHDTNDEFSVFAEWSAYHDPT